jgi:hypothetical protein
MGIISQMQQSKQKHAAEHSMERQPAAPQGGRKH